MHPPAGRGSLGSQWHCEIFPSFPRSRRPLSLGALSRRGASGGVRARGRRCSRRAADALEKERSLWLRRPLGSSLTPVTREHRRSPSRPVSRALCYFRLIGELQRRRTRNTEDIGLVSIKGFRADVVHKIQNHTHISDIVIVF